MSAPVELELGVVTLPVARPRPATSRDLWIDEIVLVARADHPFVGAPHPVPADLEGQPFVGFESGSAIRQIIDSALRAAGVQVEVVMELRSIPSILRMVATTGSLAFVSRVSLSAEPDVRQVAVRGPGHLANPRTGHPAGVSPVGAGSGLRRPAPSGLPDRTLRAWSGGPAFSSDSPGQLGRPGFSATKVLTISPRPSMRVVTTCPSWRNTGGVRAAPTPSGVPVKMRSPGRSVMMVLA